jgi:hypothetical protein
MTMPHLMNCEHQGEGWCLACVGKLQDEFQKVCDAVADIDATAWNDGCGCCAEWKLHQTEEWNSLLVATKLA